ncbi:hypothetical protein Tco_0979165 [Tanacetum coccineum]
MNHITWRRLLREEQRLCVWFVTFYTTVVELTLRVTINNARRHEVKYRQSQEVLVDIPKNLVEDINIVAENGLSSKNTQSPGQRRPVLVFPAPTDRERIKSCLSELGEMSNGSKKAVVVGLEQLVDTMTHRIRPVLDSVPSVSYELLEKEYAENKVNDPWVQRLVHAVETNSGWLQPLPPTTTTHFSI